MEYYAAVKIIKAAFYVLIWKDHQYEGEKVAIQYTWYVITY